MNDRSTFSTYTESSSVLTAEDIRKAIKMLKEASKQPFITSISSNLSIEELLDRSGTARSFSLNGGIPIRKNSLVPDGKIRFSMSDGKYSDFPIEEFIKVISSNEKRD